MKKAAYFVPAAPVQAELVIKKSRFIAHLECVSSREQAMAALAHIKGLYPDARHHCWAYVLGGPASASAAMNDDGEPSGTAGRPMLNVLQHKNMGDIMAVVVRYFGGVKLGAGGLVRAYGGAVQAATCLLTLEERQPLVRLSLAFGYEFEQVVRHLSDRYQATLQDMVYGDSVSCLIDMNMDYLSDFKKEITDASKGKVTLKHL